MKVSQFLRVVFGSLALLGALPASAEFYCYMGISEGQFRLTRANTRFEDNLLNREFLDGRVQVDGTVKKDLKSEVTEVQAGCFLFDWLAVEAGHISSIKLGTTTDVTLRAGRYSSSTFYINREADGSVNTYSLLGYTGNRSSYVRLFGGVSYIQAYARGGVTLEYGDYFLGKRLEKRATGYAPRLGLDFRLSSHSRTRVEYRYFGPRANMLMIGVTADLTD